MIEVLKFNHGNGEVQRTTLPSCIDCQHFRLNTNLQNRGSCTNPVYDPIIERGKNSKDDRYVFRGSRACSKFESLKEEGF